MTSTWRERLGDDAVDPDRDGSDLLPRDGAEGFSNDRAEPEAGRDFIGRGMSDAQDLHRLEESIRWLVDAGTGSGQTAPLPRIVGLEPDDDTLLLNPDTLFAQPRDRGVLGSAVRVVLVSAIAAPTAYFIANWLQTPGSPAPPDPVVVAAPVVLPDDRADAAPPVTGDTSAVAPVNVARAAPDETATASDSSAATPEAVTPEPAAPAPLPAPMVVPSPAVAIRSPAVPSPAAYAAIPSQVVPSPAVSAAAIPSPAAPSPAVSSAASPSAAVPPAPTAAAVPAKPQMLPQDAAKFVAKGNELFDAGDVSAARLFFRRAAEAGDAAAAMAMAATYDPEVLAKRRIRSAGNADEAQRWYALAQEMGRRGTALALGH